MIDDCHDVTELKTREERSRQYFGDTDLMAGDGYVADESETLYDRVHIASIFHIRIDD